MKKDLLEKAVKYLKIFCNDIPERTVGSAGNRKATGLFCEKVSSFGWDTVLQEFDAFNWMNGGASISAADQQFEAFVSPYSLGCSIKSELVDIESFDELSRKDLTGKIILMRGNIAGEQLMPKNFVFYNPDEHKKIISVLEDKKPAAIIAATGRNSALAGGAYPFPLIEDGDFDIPSVYITKEKGCELMAYKGKTLKLESISERLPGKGFNVIARKGINEEHRIVITAHIDAKNGTPGAIDNATGVITMILLAELLHDYSGKSVIELAALNGEDYYSAPGQMKYLCDNHDKFNQIKLCINIDGAGYYKGKTAVSHYDIPDKYNIVLSDVFKNFKEMKPGTPFPQGDHSIFVQYGCPAFAFSSDWLIENMENQSITHTPNDNPGIVDCRKIVNTAEAIVFITNEIMNLTI